MTLRQKFESIAYNDSRGAFWRKNGDISRFRFRLFRIGGAEKVEGGWGVEEDEEGSGVGVGFWEFVIGLGLMCCWDGFGEEEG